MVSIATPTTPNAAVGDTTASLPGYHVSHIIDAATGKYAWDVLDGYLPEADIVKRIEDSDKLEYKGAIASTATELPAADAGHVYKLDADLTLGGEELAEGTFIQCLADDTAAGATFSGNWQTFSAPFGDGDAVPTYVAPALPTTMKGDRAFYEVGPVPGTATDATQKGRWYTDGSTGYYKV